MKTVAPGTFKTKCLAVIDEVHRKREVVVITKRGKPVATSVPIQPKQDEIFGFLAGRSKITGDLVEPALSLRGWGNLA